MPALFGFLLLIIFFPVVLLWALTGFLYSLTVTKKVYKRPTALARFLGWFTNAGILFFTMSRVKVEGREKLPKDGRFVYVSTRRTARAPRWPACAGGTPTCRTGANTRRWN